MLECSRTWIRTFFSPVLYSSLLGDQFQFTALFSFVLCFIFPKVLKDNDNKKKFKHKIRKIINSLPPNLRHPTPLK